MLKIVIFNLKFEFFWPYANMEGEGLSYTAASHRGGEIEMS